MTEEKFLFFPHALTDLVSHTSKSQGSAYMESLKEVQRNSWSQKQISAKTRCDQRVRRPQWYVVLGMQSTSAELVRSET